MTTTIDGRALAEKIRYTVKKKLATCDRSPRLGIVEVGDDPIIESFVKIKKKVGESLGVEITHERLPKTATTEECIDATKRVSENVDGIIVQLPLPEQVDVDAVLSVIPVSKDIDVLSPAGIDAYLSKHVPFVPPVAGAVSHILVEGGFKGFTSKSTALVIGKGRLVGAPVAQWFRYATPLRVHQVDNSVRDLKEHTFIADIIVSGAGVPKLITPDMISEGVTLIDAGTSEQVGKLVGDIDPACQEKARIYTPVPGGVGPVTVAVLYENLAKAVCPED